MPRSHVAPELADLLSRLHRLCSRLGARYAIIGGLALRAYGSQRTTFDVDVALALGRSDVESLLTAAERLGFALDPPELRQRFQHQMVRLFGSKARQTKADLQLAVLPHMALALKRRRRKRLGARFYWVAAPEDMVVLKLISAREHDLTDAAFLLALPERALDRAYLRRTVRSWRLETELAEAERRTREPPP